MIRGPLLILRFTSQARQYQWLINMTDEDKITIDESTLEQRVVHAWKFRTIEHYYILNEFNRSIDSLLIIIVIFIRIIIFRITQIDWKTIYFA